MCKATDSPPTPSAVEETAKLEKDLVSGKDMLIGHETASEDTDIISSTPLSSTGKSLQSRAYIYGAASVFISMLGAACTFPFLQSQRDALGCDALCYGSMSSLRSGLSLIGSAIIGRMSDQIGRKPMLFVGLASSISSYSINIIFNSVTGMWVATIPSALLNQNYGVLKALFADYAVDGSESDRAAAMGSLGMAVGVSFMVGPLVGAYLIKTYEESQYLAIAMTLLSGVLFFLMPKPLPRLKSSASVASLALQAADQAKANDKDKNKNGILSFLSLPAAQTAGARLLFFMRLSMGLAFHVFMTVWTVSLKQRFNFSPKEHAYFMGWIGLWYALSQGVLAKQLIKVAKEDPTIVLIVCMVSLGCGRVAAMLTTSLAVVYTVMALVIISLGVVNTAISSACTRLADEHEVGGLFGVMDAVESLAGLIGPTLGGLLHRFGEHVPLIAVVAIYGAVLVAVMLFYRSTIVRFKRRKNSDVDIVAENAKKEQ